MLSDYLKVKRYGKCPRKTMPTENASNYICIIGTMLHSSYCNGIYKPVLGETANGGLWIVCMQPQLGVEAARGLWIVCMQPQLGVEAARWLLSEWFLSHTLFHWNRKHVSLFPTKLEQFFSKESETQVVWFFGTETKIGSQQNNLKFNYEVHFWNRKLWLKVTGIPEKSTQIPTVRVCSQ